MKQIEITTISEPMRAIDDHVGAMLHTIKQGQYTIHHVC